MRAEKTDTKIRREQLAEAALELVASNGLKGLSVAKLARKVGIVPSAVYRHFSGKDQVLEAMLDLIRTRLRANVQAVAQEAPGAMQKLRRLLTRHAELIQRNTGIPRVIFSGEIGGNARRRAKVHAIVSEYLAGIAGIVREGQAAGEIRGDLKAEAVGMMFIGMIQPAAFLWHVSNGGFAVTEHVAGAWDVFTKGIQAERSLS